MKTNRFVLAAFISLGLISCQKELSMDDVVTPPPPPAPGSGDPNKTLVGTYDFVQVVMQARTIVSMNVAGMEQKTVSNTSYTSEQNKGVVTIDANSLDVKGMSYYVNANMAISVFTGATLMETMDLPFVYTAPSFDANTPYKLVSADSIYLEKTAINVPVGSDLPAQGEGGGARTSWSGDTLLLTIKLNQNTIDNSTGIPIITNVNAVELLKLKKR